MLSTPFHKSLLLTPKALLPLLFFFLQAKLLGRKRSRTIFTSSLSALWPPLYHASLCPFTGPSATSTVPDYLENFPVLILPAYSVHLTRMITAIFRKILPLFASAQNLSASVRTVPNVPIWEEQLRSAGWPCVLLRHGKWVCSQAVEVVLSGAWG